MTTEISSYQQQAIDFLNKYSISFSAKYLDYAPYFPEDKESRNIYRLTLKRGKNSVSFRFGASIYDTNNNTEPNAYDLLANITKYDPESFEWFCSNYGYDTDSRKAFKTYKAVCREWEKVNKFFSSEELEELQEIN